MHKDETLILRARRGDMSAFEQLVHRYDSKVLSMALSFAQDPDEAKDIYQEVFLRVHRALPKFQFRSAFSTWMHRIVLNVCRTHYARRTRRRQVSLDAGFDGDERPLSESLVSDARTDERAVRGEMAALVAGAMEILSARQRLVFTLKHFHGYKLREIAAMMNCAEGTVKRHLFSAVHKMRRHLSPVRHKDASP